MRVLPGLIALSMAVSLSAPAFAQQGEPPSKQSLENSSACGGANTAEPATQPAPSANDGTAPGNSGSTGWSGGTGGSFIGTNPAGATASSKTWQPPTARGLDLTMAPKEQPAATPASALQPKC